MSIEALKALVKEGEHVRLEFKRKVAHPEKIVREIVAFANTGGGLLLIGVDDDGSIPGLKFASEEAYALDQAILKYCKPKIDYTTEIIPISKKKAVIKYIISESKNKPHFVADPDNKWGKVYVRRDDRSIQASKEVREILRRKRKIKDIRFNYGEKEKILMQYLEKDNAITLGQFADIAKINKYTASKTLIILVLANVLSIIPREEGDIFILNPTNVYHN